MKCQLTVDGKTMEPAAFAGHAKANSRMGRLVAHIIANPTWFADWVGTALFNKDDSYLTIRYSNPNLKLEMTLSSASPELKVPAVEQRIKVYLEQEATNLRKTLETEKARLAQLELLSEEIPAANQESTAAA